jgi:urease accessory protein
VVTTPGAARFYRSDGAPAAQRVHAELGPGARLEWLPLETIAHRGCIAANRASFALAPAAQMIGWDLLALGLPAAGEVFDRGRYTQHLELPGVWLERGMIDGGDTRLLHSPLGLAGRSALLTLWFASGQPIDSQQLDGLVDGAREVMAAHTADSALSAGVTTLQQRVVVLRALAHRVEPAMALAQAVRACWRSLAWQLGPTAPRVWRT